MLCWLCNEVEIDRLQLDDRDNKLRPCAVCEEIIFDTAFGANLGDEPEPVISISHGVADDDEVEAALS